MMKIAVIGGGVSGCTFAINRKRNHPEDEIFIFEHSDKLLKKVLATGNGKCNIANIGDISSIYNSPLAVAIVNQFDYSYQKEFLESINIKTKLMGNLSYPVSESAVTVRNAYLKAIDKLGIKTLIEVNIEDYSFKNNCYQLKTSKGDFVVNKIVIATGGKSLPKSGSDGSIIPLLLSHGYEFKDFEPALCPIYTKEKTKILDGTRIKADVVLLENSKEVFKESGEVLFKEHGLSGIVIFNMSRVIAKDISKHYEIKLDLLPDVSNKELSDSLKQNGKEELLESYLHPNIIKYLSDKSGNIVDLIKSLTFTFDKLYGFENSQISVGGLKIKEIDNNLESNKEKGIYFLGELLDVDAPCGGYNLMWAIGSGLYLSTKI